MLKNVSNKFPKHYQLEAKRSKFYEMCDYRGKSIENSPQNGRFSTPVAFRPSAFAEGDEKHL